MRLTWNEVSPGHWLTVGQHRATVEERPAIQRWVASVHFPSGRCEVSVFRYRRNAQTWCEQELESYRQSQKHRLFPSAL